MAQKTIIQLVDDLDGGEANESVSFALDGVEYNMDLSAANATLLRERFALFVEKGSRVGGRKHRGAGGGLNTAVRAGSDKAQNQAIREWARANGEKISDRGRIPAELVTKFHAAHGG
ncbi:histone-like nucleoid-structuring protein Lsr2 [Kutzneria chonburiensis]|uniref:Lsr2 family protein n=1 Tax=Kutzneria chonburiensis TaxID=1483604 RepID=A0ABV6N3E2_9PSEU|nr:Lsr2 family protein [Kutzneria chonburiensis]